jgi:antitoxin (DNA-binding transcriptional repressor) of toxin-antitoxin stability system
MRTITIRQLHDATGKWVRRAAALGELQVTEHGQVVAKIVPAAVVPERPYFGRRKMLPAFRIARPFLRGGIDSTRTISEDRDRGTP